MAVSTVGFGQPVLVYTAILVAVPLAFVLLLRVLDYISLGEVTEQYAQSPRDWQVYGDHRVDEEVAGQHSDDEGDQAPGAEPADSVACPRCGTRNGAEYTFCRSCLARIAL